MPISFEDFKKQGVKTTNILNGELTKSVNLETDTIKGAHKSVNNLMSFLIHKKGYSECFIFG
jgi:hypothetical protein